MGDSPGQKAISVMEKLNDDVVFKKPSCLPKRRKRKCKVLDEETYVEQLGKIIQRDFFPDLEKLKAQCEYLDSVERNDLSKLMELYAKYSAKKPPVERLPSPATFETPQHNSQHPLETIDSNISENLNDDITHTKPEPKLSLDQYLNSHTSQDNESFEDILAISAAKQQEKYWYLFKEEDKSEQDRQKQLALPSVEQQCALPEKKLNVDSWTYKNRNYVMFIPDGVELTPEQEIEMNKRRQEIVHSNTRLVQNPFNEVQSKETINELAKTQAKVLDGKIGVDGKELVKMDTPNIRGFSFVRTPSPSPSTMDSPLMTWGEIEGTPFRLDGSDTPLPRSQGPAFKMAEPPRRELLAMALAEKAAEKVRDRKKKAMETARRQFATPSPKRPNTPSLERLLTLSPAARRLATSKLGINSSFKRITPSPLNRVRTPQSIYSPTGSIRTLSSPLPSPKRQTTPKLNLGIKKPADNLTDNLLKIDLPKRCKASDFF